jgi:hypothetical protein
VAAFVATAGSLLVGLLLLSAKKPLPLVLLFVTVGVAGLFATAFSNLPTARRPQRDASLPPQPNPTEGKPR